MRVFHSPQEGEKLTKRTPRRIVHFASSSTQGVVMARPLQYDPSTVPHEHCAHAAEHLARNDSRYGAQVKAALALVAGAVKRRGA